MQQTNDSKSADDFDEKQRTKGGFSWSARVTGD